MTADRDEIISFLDEYLETDHISDYGVNGLQVIGSSSVSRVALGVSASLELFQHAAEANCQMTIVHHGLFWNNTPRAIGPLMKARLQALFNADITLLAYHLPLDCHREVGNGAQLARRLGLEVERTDFALINHIYAGVIAKSATPMSFTDFVTRADSELVIESRTIAAGPAWVSTFGIVSGGGASSLPEAIERNCDVFISGEIIEPSMALAREGKINCLALGHYNSEKYGILALGELVSNRFGIDVEFIDIPNPL